ncbi:MAG: hypothetical protein Q9161_001150 [Pseudevernia consocians]
MASPNEMKLPEQQSSNSNPTTSPTSATEGLPHVEITGSQAQDEGEVAAPISVTNTSGADIDPCEHVEDKSNQVAPDTATTAVSAGAVVPQQQAPTQAGTAAPSHRITDDLGADDDDDESSDFGDDEGSDADDDENWPWDPLKEEAGNNVSGHVEAPISMTREEYGSIVHDPDEYVIDGPIVIDSMIIKDSADEASEEGVGDREEGHGNEETKDSVMATSAGPVDGNGENRDSMTSALTSSDYDNADGSGSKMVTGPGSAHAVEDSDGPLPSGVGPRQETSTSNPEGNGRQGETARDEIPEASGAFIEATPNQTTSEAEIQDPLATLARELEEITSQSDPEFDHSQEEPVLYPTWIPESPLQPSPFLSSDPNEYDLDDGEAARNPVDRVTTLTGYRRAEARNADSQGEGSRIGDDEQKETTGDLREGEAMPADDAATLAPRPSQPCPEASTTKDANTTVTLTLQYLVFNSKRSKATIRLSVPVTTTTYASLKRTVLTALHQHNGFRNPRPIAAEAQISRLVAVLVEKGNESAAADVRVRVVELTDKTDTELRERLELMTTGSIYDVVKVRFVPGTNDEARRTGKATERVCGTLRKMGGPGR